MDVNTNLLLNDKLPFTSIQKTPTQRTERIGINVATRAETGLPMKTIWRGEEDATPECAEEKASTTLV